MTDNSGVTPLISVLIPTHGRAAQLGQCLAALADQDLPPDRYEVLVGLDGPDDTVRQSALAAWSAAGGTAALTIVGCKKAGPGPTRNRLIERARGSIILFINDDVIPARDLLSAHASAHAAERPAMILGAAPWKVTEPDRLFDRLIRETSMIFFYDRMTGGRADHDWGFRHAWTLNLSVPADQVRAIGGFSESLGAPCFDDLEMAWRLSSGGGLPVLFRPQARAVHDHRYEPLTYLARERMLGAQAFRLAGAASRCAAAIFGRDVRSAEELAYSREFIARERTAAERLERSFESLADTPADAIDGPHAGALLNLVYEQHLLLKRWHWRAGLLEAASSPAPERSATPRPAVPLGGAPA
jgi:GT2 family glycosyltransferase